MLIFGIITLGLMMIVAAFIAIHTKSLLVAIITSGVISLFASIIYVILASPDVAMTEAAIGSALTTVIFLFALKRVQYKNKNDVEGGIDD